MENTGDSIKAGNANWNFEGDVSKNLNAHMKKSVPLYEEGHGLIAKVSDFFLTNDTLCYELGCSTGKLIHKLANRTIQKNAQFVGIDREEGMIEAAREKCSDLKNITLIREDILDVELKKSDLIISYYTMQFIKSGQRQIIFDRIYESLNWGGGFLLFEKVRGPDARFQDMMTAIYTDYKLDQGYDEKEIIAKSRSLKGVLEPFSTQGNIDLMKRSGFVDIISIMKYVCFEGFLAIK